MGFKSSGISLLAAAALFATGCHRGEIFSVDPIVSTGAVLQQQSLVTLGGKATPGTRIKITTDWDFSVTASTGADSIWKAQIRTPVSDTLRHNIQVEAAQSDFVISDLLIGDVWLAAGQSGTSPIPYNFGPRSSDSIPSPEEVSWLADSLVRVFVATPGVATAPENMSDGKWLFLTPDNQQALNLISASLAKTLHDSLNIPIGIVLSSEVGAPVRSWCSPSLAGDGRRKVADNEMANWKSRHELMLEWLQTLQTLDIKEPDGSDALPTASVYDEFINISHVDGSTMPKMHLPGLWGCQGLPGFDGVVWLFKTIELPHYAHKAKARIVLGGLADNDLTYVNQVLVGSKADTSSWSEPGTYKIPSGTLSNRTILAIRLNGSYQDAGIYGPADGSKMRIELSDDPEVSFPIDGEWSYVAAARFTPGGDRLYLMGLPDNQYMSEFREADHLPKYLHGVVYNKMLAPLSGFPVTGAACHFGEADIVDSLYVNDFASDVELLVATLRNAFGNASLPIFFNQMPPVPSAIKLAGGKVRSALVDAVNNAGRGVYVTSLADMGEGGKFSTTALRQLEEGRRCAAAILDAVYHFKGAAKRLSPMPREALTDYQVVNIEFDNVDTLVINTALHSAFEVAGADSVFYPAKALASGRWITMFSHMVQEPRYARYAFCDSVKPTLSSVSGQLAPAFCLRCSPKMHNDD